MGMEDGCQRLIEVRHIIDVYADGIGAVEILGSCFRTVFFSLQAPLGIVGAKPDRIVVAKIVRPLTSYAPMALHHMIEQQRAGMVDYKVLN